MQRALDEVHPGTGVLFGRPGWTGQQAVGITWGGDQPSDFWSLRTLVAATLTAAASGFSNWSHDVGGYLGERLVARAPEGAARALGAVRLLHAADAGARALRAGGVDVRRGAARRSTATHVLLHERLVPYVRAAAATAQRTGLPIVRPLALTDPRDVRGWSIADAYGYGPSLWVAPVLEDGARSVHVDLPRGDWIDLHTGAEHRRRRRDRRARAAGPHPGLGAPRRADRHLSRRRTSPAGSATRRSASARSRRRCTASRPAAVRWPASPTARGSATTAANVVRHAPTVRWRSEDRNLAQRSVHNLARR